MEFRDTGRSALSAVSLACLGLFFIAYAAPVLPSAAAWFFVALGCAFLFGALNTFRSGIFFEGDELVLRTLAGTHRFSRDDVAEVTTVANSRLLRDRVLIAIRDRDGRVVPCWGLPRNMLTPNGMSTLNDLRDAVRRWKSGAP